jgi:glycosyltransferase involved in cell wall biosynthesis
MPPHLGGLEVAAETIFDAYRTAGIDVRWIASRVPENLPPDGDSKIRVRCWNGLENWFGVPWPIWGPAGVKRLCDLIRWADVVHVHDCLYLCSALAVFVARQFSKPVIISQHIGFVSYPSILFNGLERVAYSTLGRAVLRGASYIAFCTPAAAEFVTELLEPMHSPASLIPYGIDTERFKPAPSQKRSVRDQFRLPEESPLVLFAGRLVEKKGIDLLLQVIRLTPRCHFFIVGDGPLKPEPAKNLTWVQFIPPEQMAAVYQTADVFFLPSHSEGFPLAILEAMASGLPVVTSRGQTFGEIIEREGAGVLSDRTATAFCQRLNEIFDWPEQTSSMKLRARQLVKRDYSIAALGTRYLELVNALACKN